MTDLDLAELAEEPSKVRLWVIEQLVEAGFSPNEALYLHEARADYHRALAMLAAGATHEQVVRILT